MSPRLRAGAWGAISGQTCLVHSFHLKSPISPKIQVTVWEQPEQKSSPAPGPAQLWAVWCLPPGPPGLGWHSRSPEKSWTAESLGRAQSSGVLAFPLLLFHEQAWRPICDVYALVWGTCAFTKHWDAKCLYPHNSLAGQVLSYLFLFS